MRSSEFLNRRNSCIHRTIRVSHGLVIVLVTVCGADENEAQQSSLDRNAFLCHNVAHTMHAESSLVEVCRGPTDQEQVVHVKRRDTLVIMFAPLIDDACSAGAGVP